jgi:regulatory protein
MLPKLMTAFRCIGCLCLISCRGFGIPMEKDEKRKKTFTPHEALVKAEAWCAYQERCQQEVRDKLYSWGLHERDVENGIAELISRGFLNEERFAKAYAGGKFRIKKWGRVKIRIELKRRKLSEYCIKKGLAEIEEDDYMKTLRKVAEEKTRTTKEKHALKKKYKVMNYLLSRGFENDLVREVVGEIEDSNI